MRRTPKLILNYLFPGMIGAYILLRTVSIVNAFRKSHPLALSRRRRSYIPAVLRWRLGSAPRRTPASPASGHTSPTAAATRPARCCAAPLGLDRRRACERVGTIRGNTAGRSWEGWVGECWGWGKCNSWGHGGNEAGCMALNIQHSAPGAPAVGRPCCRLLQEFQRREFATSRTVGGAIQALLWSQCRASASVHWTVPECRPGAPRCSRPLPIYYWFSGIAMSISAS